MPPRESNLDDSFDLIDPSLHWNEINNFEDDFNHNESPPTLTDGLENTNNTTLLEHRRQMEQIVPNNENRSNEDSFSLLSSVAARDRDMRNNGANENSVISENHTVTASRETQTLTVRRERTMRSGRVRSTVMDISMDD